MSAANSTLGHLRLVRDDDPVELALPGHDLALPGLDLQSLQQEVMALQQEISQLRHQGEKLNFHLSRIDEELKLAARLQQDFLPKQLPQLGQVHFHTLFRPASFVSGDFYDVIRLDENHIGFYIADAVGHGVPAALLTMFIKHALATKQIGLGGYRLLSPAETMTRLNATLIEQGLSAATFATAIYGIINIATQQVTFTRAGHPHPLVLRAGGGIESIEVEGGLLGVFDNEQFQEQSIQLAPGDRLLLVTDGVEVAFGADITGSQNRWQVELHNRHALPAEDFIASFADLIDHPNDEIALRDDLTLLMLEIRPGQ